MESFGESYCYDDDEEVPVAPKLVFDPVSLLFLPLFVVLVVLFLGLLKAMLGLCSRPIGKWGYNYMQPFHPYDRSTKCRQFRMNLIFFFIAPCLYCCATFCCKWRDISDPTTNGTDVLEKGRLKKRFVLKREQYEVPEGDEVDDADDSTSESNTDVPSEKIRLLGHSYDSYAAAEKYIEEKRKKYNDRFNNSQVADGTPQNNKNDNHPRASAGLASYKTIDEDDEAEQEDTKFVLSTMSESRDSMRCLDGIVPSSKMPENDDDKYSPEVNAFIKTLLETQMVYRAFTHPIGNISVENGQKYSIRGFFIPSLGNKYKFITNLPLRQHWKIAKEGNLVPLFPPIVLLSREFTRLYENKQDVFDSRDLLVKATMDAPVLNMQLQGKYDGDGSNNTNN